MSFELVHSHYEDMRMAGEERATNHYKCTECGYTFNVRKVHKLYYPKECPNCVRIENIKNLLSPTFYASNEIIIT